MIREFSTMKDFKEMSLMELKERLRTVEFYLKKFRYLKALGYDRYEIMPKIRRQLELKKQIKEAINSYKEN